MLLQNKNRIAYLSALTLLFSYAEMLLPRIVPFFRLGLGNIAILLAFDLSIPAFTLLTLIKAITSCMMSGTLFSPFFLISLTQSVFSGFVMYFLAKLNSITKDKLFSIYGISITGASISSIVQIGISSLYLGTGTAALLGPMLIFSIFSGILTAFLSQILHIPEETPLLHRSCHSKKNTTSFLMIFLIVLFVLLTFMIKNLIILSIFLIIAITVQLISGRKFLIIPHISLWIFVIISTLFVPEGKVLFKIGTISITQGALYTGLIKSLKLSTVSAISQAATTIQLQGNGILNLTLAYFSALNLEMKKTNGHLLEKIKHSLSVSELYES